MTMSKEDKRRGVIGVSLYLSPSPDGELRAVIAAQLPGQNSVQSCHGGAVGATVQALVNAALAAILAGDSASQTQVTLAIEKPIKAAKDLYSEEW